MYDQLDEIRRTDHRDYDCFVCCILSHGQNDEEVFGSDGVVNNIKDLTGLFTGVKCPSLAGKPKVFLFQACRGHQQMDGVQPMIESDSPGDKMEPTIPDLNDVLIGYSTSPGHASFRHRKKGSWYISSLVQAFLLYHEEVDVENLLKIVHNHLCKCSDMIGYKQSSPRMTLLPKTLYL